MKINTLHSTMHASKLSSWALEYKRVNGSHMSIKQGQPRGIGQQCWPLLSVTLYHFLLGKHQRGLAPNFQAGSLVWVWGQFWLGAPPAQANKALFFSPRNSHKWGFQLFSTHDKHRVVTKISSCRVNTTSRRGIKRLGICFGSIFLLFSNKSSQGPLS